jgi:glycosyltransferase involved in cell wall biosynthesis
MSTRRRRLALIVPGGLDPSGDTRIIPGLLWLAERLAHRHDLEVFSLRQCERPSVFDVHGVRVWDAGLATCPAPVKRILAVARFLAWLRARPAFDTFHGCWLGLPSILATMGARRQGKPAVVSIMGTELASDPLVRRRPFTLRLSSPGVLRRAARVTTGSRYLAAHAAAFGIVSDVVPLGVDGSWSEGPVAPAGPPWRLLHVASLNPWKDQVTLLRAIADMVRAGTQVRLDVVGQDTLDGAIQQEAARLGVDDVVTFHGPVPSAPLRAFYRRAHLLVLSSCYEAQGVVVLEAALHTVPTVGTAVGLIADGNREWTVGVPVRDPAALALAIDSVLGDAAWRAALGARAARWARKHDANWTAGRFSEIYEEVGA